MNGRGCVRLLFLLVYVTLKFYCLLIGSIDGNLLCCLFDCTNFSSSVSS